MSAVVLEGVLSREQRESLLALAEGKLIRVGAPERKKHRFQVPNDYPEADSIAGLVVQALTGHPLFQMATYPEACSPPRLCCYGPGMGYRDHLDQPRMGEDRIRTDISVTISLADPETYDGGELVIDSDRDGGRWKGKAGDCLIYPGDSIHRVEPVTRGTRLVCILWIESLVRDASKRQILFDLANGFLSADTAGPAGPRAETMRRCHGNLLRMWARR
jgi:PKHD-type hydroxylase